MGFLRATTRSIPLSAADTHPSAPIPVQGPPLGEAVRVPLGETGMDVFPVMLGGSEFGWNVDLAAAHAILDRYVGLGGNAIHTSDSFSGGRSEHIIGQFLHTRGLRDDVTLAVRVGRHPDHPGLGPVNLVRAVEASLLRLRTDRIDVLYLDSRSDPDGSIEQVLATANWLIEAGKVRALAAADSTAAALIEARILSSAGYPRVSALEVAYNVLRRKDFPRDLQLITGAQGIAVTPSQSLEHGFLTGEYRSRRSGARSSRARLAAASVNRRSVRVLNVLDEIAAELSVSVAVVAVAWLLSQRHVTAPIVNAVEPEHVDDMVRAVGVRLSRAQLAEIERVAA